MKTTKQNIRFYLRFLNPFYAIRYLRATLRLRNAINYANEAHARNHQRFYVLPMLGGGLMVTDRYNFRKGKQSGRVLTGSVSQTPTMRDVMRECFYFTPLGNGTDTISDNTLKSKRRQYYRWKKLI